MHFACASGSENFRCLTEFANVLLCMSSFYESVEVVAAAFQRCALIIYNEGLTEITERLGRLDAQRGLKSSTTDFGNASANCKLFPFNPFNLLI